MAEQPVFWLGGNPGTGKKKIREKPAAESYEPAIRDACTGCGYELDEYVAAQGGFGGWLAHLERNGSRFRIFWSGKDHTMKFEQAVEQGGWKAISALGTSDENLPVFITAIGKLLADTSGKV